VNWLTFLVFLVMTPVYYCLRLKHPAVGLDQGAIWQTAMMSLMFAAWAFALGGPFAGLSWYNPTYGALVLTVIAFAVPVIVPRGTG
jgi:hypothetical protein